ncbi:transglutaminase-like cysteine peptidase [Methylocystis parvus]|uniref:Transglutaminase-like cysteine peptidase n=1 Tax=Methylocystis parvus TaxID=134 RepID=A0A6B8M2X2_9HYPH|nr:transglutaminase-like cysteine peptidase [Methylocystis parvus]QGM96522.1 transglutaminase-like cysteine peptidase [Methylocystis parvus]WBJ99627.1 transglutaminase-like cysteine peptidase [Methylocystis parvus OBBP]
MVGIIGKTIVALGLAGAGLVAVAATSLAGSEAPNFAPVGAETSVPYGWVEFCQRNRAECDDEAGVPTEIKLDAAAYNKIARINAWVNKHIDPIADADHWGAIDQWDYPSDGKGDCEDYALLKRRMLIDQGFPREALLLTVVKEKNGDGHSVLTVRTNRGEFILDNLADQVKLWKKTPYRFVKRQSQHNQNVWVAIGEPTAAPAYVSNQ